ncbi:MAG: ROK family protein [Desulfurococcales archaeon]|nr:ROK family protein [Desulfurococcales archaeon]
MAEPVLAVDIGATKTLIGLFIKNKLKKYIKMATPDEGIEWAIREKIIELFNKNNINRIEYAGIAAPGPLDYTKGQIVNPPNMKQTTISLIEMMEDIARYVLIANDTVAGVWAEKTLGKHRSENMVLVSIGSGVGGGVIVDDHLLLGSRGNAHEIGHIPLNLDEDAPCGCGGQGHWEALAGGVWIPRTAKRLAYNKRLESRAWRLAYEGSLTPELLFNLARENDEFALFAVDYLCRVHGAGIAAVKYAYDPDLVVLSGGVYLRNKDMMFDRIKRYMRVYLGSIDPPQLYDASFGEYQSLYGAYAIIYSPPTGLVHINRHKLAPPARG